MILQVEIEDGMIGEGPRDKYVMERVREKANTIHSNIRATCDYGSNYTDGKLPVLDEKIWIGESERNGTKVLYEFYMKDVSSRQLINYRSAHPESMKINVLVNEALRIMRNCSKHLNNEIVTNHLQYFVKRMQFSDYPQEYRYEVLSRAFKIDRASRRRVGTRSCKRNRKKDWYDGKRYDGCLFVDVTMNSELKRRVQEACKRNKLRVKVVEKMDRTVKNMLQQSNPFGWNHCGRMDCPTCNRGIQINCRTRGCTYEIGCLDCELVLSKQYRGQTGRSTYERMKEHFSKWESKADDSILHKHAMEHHSGEVFEVDVKLLTRAFGKPSTRMIAEAVEIEELPDENSLNSKSEWTFVKLPRVDVI